jgi:Phytanoyl-CoA dioxygenase (PhyH)
MSATDETLRSQGYVVLKGVVDPSAVRLARARALSEWETIKHNGQLWVGGGTIVGHINYSPAPDLDVFFDALTNPQVLESIENELGDDRYLQVLGGNANLPKSRYQPAHVDTAGNDYVIVNVPLGDADETNGSLEIWPGSHHEKIRYAQITASQKQIRSTRVNTQAGDVVLRYPHVWHRGTPNKSAIPRIMLAACLGKRRDACGSNLVELSVRNHNLFMAAGIQGNLVCSSKTSGRFYPNYFYTRPIGVLRELFVAHAPIIYHGLKIIGR